MRTYTVNAGWDQEAGVWIASSPDVGGLFVQAQTLDQLIEVV